MLTSGEAGDRYESGYKISIASQHRDEGLSAQHKRVRDYEGEEDAEEEGDDGVLE